MVKYIVKRVLYSIAILLLVSMILYCLMRLLPTDYLDNKFADKLQHGDISYEQLYELKASYGLTSSIPVGYWKWLTSALSGDLGLSFKYEDPVTKVIFDHMWISFGVAIVAYIFQFLIAIPLGIKAATKQYGAVDYTTSVFAMIGISLPSFFLSYLLLYIFATQLGWLPPGGMFDATVDWTGNSFGKFMNIIYHMLLPMIAIIIGSIGGLMRHTRTNTLEVLNQDYIRTARAKGLSEHKVVYKHVFRNTMVPIVTMTAGIIPSLFGGMLILEQVFRIDGIGNVVYEALNAGDIPLIMGYNMFIAILTVLGTLLSDIAYMLVDPRIKISK
ncbi:MAG: ABC transporter permease [Clostridiales bacterium]|nr:ABC transporter permease [Clostridiales bacterium]